MDLVQLESAMCCLVSNIFCDQMPQSFGLDISKHEGMDSYMICAPALGAEGSSAAPPSSGATTPSPSNTPTLALAAAAAAVTRRLPSPCLPTGHRPRDVRIVTTRALPLPNITAPASLCVCPHGSALSDGRPLGSFLDRRPLHIFSAVDFTDGRPLGCLYLKFRASIVRTGTIGGVNQMV